MLLQIKLTHDGKAKDKETAEFAITLDSEITPDENNTLAALLPCKDKDGEYAAFRAKYDKDTKLLTFSVPEYGKYFSMTNVKIVELNAEAKFDGEEEQKKSSSSGCNAGFGALALFALAGLALRRRNK